MMTEDGTIARTDAGWMLVRELPSTLPDTVQAVIASRLDLLGPDEKRVMQDASVVGRIFWEGAVAELAGGPTSRALDALVDKGLLLERGRTSIEGERELIFNHVLTRDVAYAGIPRARLAGAHAAVAGWLEERVARRAEEFAEILAFHFGQTEDHGAEARYAMLAGHRHRRVFAAEQAIAWYERALGALGSDGSGRLSSEIALARGEALEQLGRFEEALDDYEAALVAASRADADDLEARALAAKAHVLWLLDRYEAGSAVLPEALERARATGATDLEARLLYTAGTIGFGRGAFDEALRFHADALRVATAGGDDEGRALALHGLCETRFFVGPIHEGLANGLEADAILRRLGQRPMVHHNEYMVAWLEWFVGEKGAIARADASVDGCLDVGNVRDEIMARNCRIQMLLARAKPGSGADALRAVEAATEIGVPRALMIALINSADVAAEPWAFDLLRERVAAASEIHARLGTRFFSANVAAFDGWVALLDGDERRAIEAFDRAQASDLAPLDRKWAIRTEFAAWESTADAPRMLAVADRDTPPLDETVWSLWQPVARAVALAALEEWPDALDAALLALEQAERAPERRAERRLVRVVWLALRALGRTSEATAMRDRAAASARAVAEAIDAFLATLPSPPQPPA
ncbi:MAG: ATP-binding protein, partial [Actinomycetota bacterium]